MYGQGHCTYHDWNMVIEVVAHLLHLQCLDFDIEAENRRIEPLLTSTPTTKRSMGCDEISSTMRQWLVEHDQIIFEIVHTGCLNKAQSLSALHTSLDFAYHIVIARYRNGFDRGPLPRPGFVYDIESPARDQLHQV